MNYLVTVVETWRVPDMVAADALEAEFRKDGTYNVSKSVKTEKVYKKQGEVVLEFVLVQTTKVFNDMKEPDSMVRPSYE